MASGASSQGALCTPPKLLQSVAPCAHAAVQGSPALEPVQRLGLVLVIFGEALRKAGILTARRNFTHVVQLTRRPGHTLVTHGVYAFVRHPGYLGWFIWAVNTQVLLLNPVCALGFAAASCLYFRRRVRFEEARLLHFFGSEYREYKARTPAFIPGV